MAAGKMKADSMSVRNTFSPDRPISTKEDDLLNRASFAESVAKAISGWKGNDSLVIAVCGPWGSGKTSVKNLILNYIQKNGDGLGMPIAVEFNPWQWAGEDKLTYAFFERMAEGVGKSHPFYSWRRFRWSRIRAYGRILSEGLPFVQDWLSKLFVPVLCALIGSSCLMVNDLSVRVWTFVVLMIVLAAFGWVLPSVARFFGVASVSLEEMKRRVAHSLSEQEKPLLMVLDDIDRLASDEMYLLFRLIKANSDFPNVVYLLLFQRDVVEKNLGTFTGTDGGDFLEKVVQVSFSMPHIRPSQLEALFGNEVEKVLSLYPFSKKVQFDSRRWDNLFHGGLKYYFASIRDIRRFVNALGFHLSLLQNGGVLDVNLVDLLALEVLRQFESELYHALPSIKDRLVTPPGENSKVREAETNALATLLSALSLNNVDHCNEILRQLFPHFHTRFGGSYWSREFEFTWEKELRVCHSVIFDRYFCFHIPDYDISQLDIDTIIGCAGDREALVEKFTGLFAQGKLGAAIKRLYANRKTIASKHALSFITALFDAGDLLTNRRLMRDDPIDYLRYIVSDLLKREDNLESRAKLLLRAVNASRGLYPPVLYTSSLAPSENKDSNRNEPLIDMAYYKRLERACRVKIRQASRDGRLAGSCHFRNLLLGWRQFDKETDVRLWLEEAIKDKTVLLAFLNACICNVTSQGVGDYVSQNREYFDNKLAEMFISLDVLARAAKKLKYDTLGTTERGCIDKFRHAYDCRAKGKADPTGIWSDNE